MKDVVGDLLGLAVFLGLFFFGVYVSLLIMEWVGMIHGVVVLE